MLSPGLDPRSLEILVDALEDDAAELPELASSLWEKLSPGKNIFVLGATITALLQDRLLPLRTQRIVAIYLLKDLIGKKGGDAFGIVFKEIVRSGEDWERALIGKLVMKGASTNWKSATALFEEIDEKDERLKGEAERWVGKFEDKTENEKLKPISAVILDEIEAAETPRLVEEVGDEVGMVDFVPGFPKLPPPVMDIDDEELVWVEPQVLHDVVWDPMMGQKNARGAELAELMSKALKMPLQPAQQEHVLSLLEADHKVVYYCGMTPEKLPDLVEMNPRVAKEVVLRLINSVQILKYFTTLANMELSPNSMEFVSQLTNTVQLPPEFLHMFITNCIQSCRNEDDKYRQNRLVRLVLVFLLALIKNKAVDARDVLLEVGSFCADFGRTKEAAMLYRVLQNADKA